MTTEETPREVGSSVSLGLDPGRSLVERLQAMALRQLQPDQMKELVLDLAGELKGAREELDRVRKSERDNEAQLVRIAQCVGRDARGAPDHDRTIAGAAIDEIERLRADLAARDARITALIEGGRQREAELRSYIR